MNQLLLVFLGGGSGAVVRWWLYQRTLQWQWLLWEVLPVGTLIANVAGCLFLGVLYSRHQETVWADWGWPLLATGFCGGLTTFSTLVFEVYQLQEKVSLSMTIAYLGCTLLSGMACFWIGLKWGSFTTLF